MIRFLYLAMDENGREQRGHLSANDEREAASQLKEQGLFPTSIREDRGKKDNNRAPKIVKVRQPRRRGLNITIGTPRIRSGELATVTRQLATLLAAGLPLVRALRTLHEQTKDAGEQAVLADVASAVEGGATFSEALAQHPKTFNRLFVNMVRAGEASGAMDDVLNRLAGFMEKSQQLRSKVKAAMVYPVAVLTIAAAITSGLMIFIVPKFEVVFQGLMPGEPLPGLTLFVMQLSHLMLDKVWLFALAVVAVVGAYKLARGTSMGRYVLDYALIKMPPFGSLQTKVAAARFCATFGTLMTSGVSVLQALKIVRDTAGNTVVEGAIQSVHDSVQQGEPMSLPLAQAQVFPGMVVSMIEVGEETGALPDMLGRIAASYEEEVDRAVMALTSLIEPVMIVVLAVVVGGIVTALFMPLIIIIERMG